MRKLKLQFFILCLFSTINLSAYSEAPESSQVTFLQNKGQWQPEIFYKGISTLTSVSFLKSGLSFSQSGEIHNPDGTEEYQSLVWNMKFIKSNQNVQIEGENRKESVISFLYGKDAAKWIIHPPEYSAINYNNIYKNVDLKFYGAGNNLKYDFIVKPGADINSIKAYYEGVQRLSVNKNGELEIETLWNVQLQKSPVAWQLINEVKHFINVQYKLINDTTFGFVAIDNYDKNYELIIDPLFEMVWASYTKALGASNNMNYCFGSAMDNEGNVYLTGRVDGTLPVTPGAYSGPGTVDPEITVSKFSSDGTTLIYSTYISGSSEEMGLGLAVDDSGRAYVTGVVNTNITGSNTYPATANAFKDTITPGSDAILTVLNSTGTGLVYSTFFGGSSGETAHDIKIGNDGMVYITGVTYSSDFPVKASSAIQSGPPFSASAFVAKFDISQSGSNSLVYSTKIGGSGNTTSYSIAIDNVGSAYITGGYSNFGSTPFYPTTIGAYNSTYSGGNDNVMVFVTKLSASIPLSLDYSTFIGPGTGNGIIVNPVTGDAYITGFTRTFSYPVTPGVLQPVHGQDALGNPNDDAFVTKLNASGSALVYSTFLGGELQDEGTGIAINSNGEAYIVGETHATFPTSPGAFQPNSNGISTDFFVVQLNSDATGYGCGGSTYVGGTADDYGTPMYDFPSPLISIKDFSGVNDTIFITGTSHSQDFPTTPGAYEPNKLNGIADQPVFFKMTCALTGVPPVANFNSVINQSCNITSVDFSDNSVGNPTTWQWSFPGASTSSSTQQNPQGIAYATSGTFNITLIACNQFGCDTLSSSISITISQNFSVNLGNDTTICNGKSVILSAPSGFANYNWQLNGNNIGSNSPSLNATQAGIYSVLITDSLGCTGTDSLAVNINTVIVSLGSDITICNNDSILITSTSGFAQYQWLLNGNIIPLNTNSFYASMPGTYTVTVTDSIGCIASDSLNLFVNNPAVTAGGNLLICENDSVLISATPGFSQYQWFLNGNLIAESGNSFYVTLPGTYIVIVSDNIGCTATDDIIIQETEELVASFNYTMDFTCDGIELRTINESQNASAYQWILNNGTILNDTNFIQFFESIQNLTIQLIALNGNCTDTATVANISFVIPELKNVPNIITPNGDDLNDCLKIAGLEQLSECFTIHIFNRWGGLVFNSDNMNNCWNGKNNNGDDLSEGVYFYSITINETLLNGVVHLIR